MKNIQFIYNTLKLYTVFTKNILNCVLFKTCILDNKYIHL